MIEGIDSHNFFSLPVADEELEMSVAELDMILRLQQSIFSQVAGNESCIDVFSQSVQSTA